MDVYTVTLEGPAPWGFRLQGGKDFSMPLTVSRLTPGGKAVQANVGVGDWVVSIDGANTESMTHVEAQNKIRACTGNLTLSLSRAVISPGSNQKMESLDKHSLRMDQVQCNLSNDSSKKRLMEDTQDWQPRTGTTQSRSFRMLAQLTGTEFMQDPDDENLKRSRHEVNQPAAKTATTAAAVDKPHGGLARAPAPSSTPSYRPPWITDPGFADRYRPDKTSTVLTQHSQPAQPTPVQNRSSIMQAAQQAPEGSGRTPVCGQCNKIIRGRYLVALGKSWHPEEFTCCQCKVVLEEGGFFEERGSIYCTKCYDSRYAPNCAKCKKTIAGEIMHALKMTWHVQCFVCAACKAPIRNKAFYMEEGEPYCETDYDKMFGTKCSGCDFKIDAGDRFLEALGTSWHDTCFVCAICQINLEGKTFYSKKDKPLCKTHAFSHV
ncbi:PDZ and LIM domain protein 7 isoform X3 [Polyodon spathula]|uniref:PDZ and LIM domain protein 7 isoform X3 n=1 Tax=Polyodon spathula TaxID=7913 RepID=UPI001B7E989A|nr:PDZ and LIM domain protein 7 isoform X3 [Polyodon spathula]